MRPVFGFIGAGIVGAALGMSGLALYLDNVRAAPPAKPRSTVTGPSHAALAGDYQHMTPAEQAAADQRAAESRRIIAQATDWGLTDDRNGRAEWTAANNDSVTCGVTPEGRYYVVKNALGVTRYDEPAAGPLVQFENAWISANCEATAPIHQAVLLRKAVDERLYQETHPLDPDCVARQFKELATSGAVAAKRQAEHPHECNRR